MVFTQKGFERLLRKHAGGMFLGSSRIHGLMNAPGTGVGIRLSRKWRTAGKEPLVRDAFLDTMLRLFYFVI
jgi:hypothetical protein